MSTGHKAKLKLTKTRALVKSGVPDRESVIREALSSVEIRALTARINGLRRDTNRQIVDVGLDVGQLLTRGKEILRGIFQHWIRGMLHIDPKTASNQLALARAADAEPNFIEDWKELGLSKLYRLARLDPRARQKVLRTADLADKNELEFARLLKNHRPARKGRVTPRMRAHGVRMKVRAWAGKARALKLPTLAPADRADLRKDFADLVAVLQAHIEELG